MPLLLDLIKDAKEIICAITFAPIPDYPMNVDGNTSAVSTSAYIEMCMRRRSEHGPFLSITNPSKTLSVKDIKLNHELYNKITKIHRAIEDTIAEKRMDILETFFKETDFDMNSYIQTSDGATKTIAELSGRVAVTDEDNPQLNLTTGLGIELLQYHSELVAMISADIINHISRDGRSPSHELVIYDSGMKILEDNPELVAKISSKTLNHFDSNNMTLLFWLIYKPGGVDFLRRNPQLVSKIIPETLNHQHNDISDSQIYHLLKNENGRKLLEENPQLLGMISSQALGAFGSEGTKILEENQNLLNMIPQEVLKAIYTVQLSENGRKTLHRKIFPSGVISMFTHPITIAVASTAVAYWHYHCSNSSTKPLN